MPMRLWILLILLLVGCASTPEPKPRSWLEVQYDLCVAEDDQMCFDLLASTRDSNPTWQQKGVEAGEIACDRGMVRACRYLIVVYDDAKARQMRERLCDQGEEAQCHTLYRDVMQSTADHGRALPYAQKFCALQHGPICLEVLNAIRDGEWNASPKERAIAFELALCAAGRPGSVLFGSDLPEISCKSRIAVVHLGGRGYYKDAFKDLERANDLFTEACTEGDLYGCSQVALATYVGRGREPDPERGIAGFRETCQRGDPGACYLLGRALLDGPKPRDVDGAIVAFERACGDDTGCTGQVARIFAFKGLRTEALALAERACAGGAERSCENAGRLAVLLRQKDNPYIDNLRRACDAQVGPSCLALARAHKLGLGVKRSSKEARRYTALAHEARGSTKYWRSVERGLDGTGSACDSINAALSIGLVSPAFFGGIAHAAPQRWDFSDEMYVDLAPPK